MRERQRGHAMIELAISAGVMVAFLGGTFEFGYTFYVYNQLVSAVGNGGRYAAQRSYRAATPDDIEKGKAAIRNMVVYGDSRPGPDAVPLVANLKPEQVKVEWVPGESDAPSAVNVSIANYNVNAMFGEFTFKGRPGVEFPFVGRYAPSEREN
jgi:Flp pilus assembly protein TadG